MSKYHLTAEGPKLCGATVRACPLGGEHFATEEAARTAYEARMASTGLRGMRRPGAPTGIPVAVTPLAGGRYYGASVEREHLERFLREWRTLVGEQAAEAMAQAKAQRDRGHAYHMTVVTPPEMKALRAGGGAPPTTATVICHGVGKASEGSHEAWFVVCSSPEVAAWRGSVGLPPKDLHITLGFRGKDVHSQPKGFASLVAGSLHG